MNTRITIRREGDLWTGCVEDIDPATGEIMQEYDVYDMRYREAAILRLSYEDVFGPLEWTHNADGSWTAEFERARKAQS